MAELLKVADVARALNVGTSTVRRWIASGRLVPVQLPSGQYRVRRETVDELLQPHTEKQPQEAA